MLPPDFRFPLRAISGVVLGLWGWGAAHAQNADTPPLVLRPSSLLEEKIPAESVKEMPSFLQGDSLLQQNGFEASLDGQVIFRRGELLIKADHIDYDQLTDLATAKGNVYINRAGTVYRGPEVQLQVDAFEGFFTQPTYQMMKNKAYGSAKQADFLGQSNTVMHSATYTTCQRKPGPDWAPDWLFKGDEIRLDLDRNIGNVEGGSLRFKGVPVMPIPSVDFPLDSSRKSGLLPPSIGVDNIGGLQYTQPIYWNLAPNRDMTFYPTYWSSRGINLGTEFRYLESIVPMPPFQGQARVDYMMQDKERNSGARWSTNYTHAGVSNPYLAGGAIGFNLNVNRVSDDNYWKDFALNNPLGIQRLLSNDVAMSWSNGIYTFGMKAQKWQTLQDLADVSNRITPPFDRVPQLTARMQKLNVANGFDFVIDGDVSRFESVRNIDCSAASGTSYNNCAPNANRFVTQAQLSRPFITPYGYLTPKVQLNSRTYQFDGGLPSTGFYTQTNSQGLSSASVTVPTMSIDTGIAFERPSFLFGRNWTQTLEPRLLYVYTPYRNQNYLPNYDSGTNAFNFASIFAENTFGGYDRIADSHTVTIGATSRLIDLDTGAEGARFAVAQRLRLADQRVTIPEYDATAKSGVSDLLGGASMNLSRHWTMESVVDYNPNTGNFLRRMVGGRYSPGSYRQISAAYRADNDEAGTSTSRQIDMGWQWPLHDLWRGADINNAPGQGLGEGRWYSVGRMNYSPMDGKVVDSIIGFEYDGGCWLSRVVREKVQVADGVARQRILFQLELVGMSSVGTNALSSLRTNVQRYQPLRQPTMAPSRFGNYD
jgi:LPS-assembly protein